MWTTATGGVTGSDIALHSTLLLYTKHSLTQDLEEKVLRLLRESSGHLLDDEALITTLNNARTTSGEWGEKVLTDRMN